MFSVPAATTTAPASTLLTVPSSSTYSTPVASPSSIDDPLDACVGAQLEQAGRPGVVDVGVERRLARVRRTALEARAAAHAVRVGVRADRLEFGAECTEAGLDGAHALPPVGALADAQPPLNPVVVRREVGGAEGRAVRADEPARLVPLREVLRVGAQRHLRVDRGRASDTPAGNQPDRAAGPAVDQREPDRPPELVCRLRLPAREIGCGAVRADLQQQHSPAALCELACHDSATRPGADHDDVEPLAFSPLRRRQSRRFVLGRQAYAAPMPR